jgi:16S rRNA (cytidine1402-2'-O)-methyltransferase
MGTLFIIATPIGNLSDMSARAIDVLGRVDIIACEDTRQTVKLLNHSGIRKPLTSYHEFNEEQKARELAGKIEAGQTVALVSDAGTPAISDPGYRLIRLCRQRGIPVVAIPGPNAAITALSASGLPSNEFMFVGFLPPKKNARREKLTALRDNTCTLVFYETPHRIAGSLGDIQEVLGDREVCIARELTKIHEEYLFGKLSEVRDRVKPIGEFVIVAAGAAEKVKETIELSNLSRKEALKVIADKLGASRNELYDALFGKGFEL